jgi:hypothetical protein
MKNILAFFAAIFVAKKSRFGCFGTVFVFVVVYYLVKNIL